MNPVFWLLVVLGIVLVWWFLTPLFRKIGKSFTRAANKTKETMFEDETERKN